MFYQRGCCDASCAILQPVWVQKHAKKPADEGEHVCKAQRETEQNIFIRKQVKRTERCLAVTRAATVMKERPKIYISCLKMSKSQQRCNSPNVENINEVEDLCFYSHIPCLHVPRIHYS